MYFSVAIAITYKLPSSLERANVTTVPSTSERDPIVLGHQHLVALKYRNTSSNTGILDDQVKNVFSSSKRFIKQEKLSELVEIRLQ